jgi:hypothetical protein
MGEESKRARAAPRTISTLFAGGSSFLRKWGAMAGVFAAVVCFAIAGYYYASFLTAPLSQHIYGTYYGLRNTAELFSEYAIFSLAVAAWMNYFSARLVLASAIAVALLVLNVAFLWTSGVLSYLLPLIPKWFPQTVVIDYLAFVQFPTVRAALDYYYLGWLGVLFLLSMALFRSKFAAKLIHSLELVGLTLLALPVEVYLFDRREFDIRVTDAQLGTRLQWFTNADLLAMLVTAVAALALLDGLVLKDGIFRRVARRPLRR